MSDIFFREMQIPVPDINLEVGSNTHGKMTGEMLYKIENILFDQKPDCVLVYGDTNSTLAGALAASKIGIPVAHVEAGLRSYYKKMPEEQNRIITDHLSDLLFCPTKTASENLRKEGIENGVYNVGDIMYDASLYYREIASDKIIEKIIKSPNQFYLLTLHRAENTDDPVRLSSIVQALNTCDWIEALFPIHPRTRKMLKKYNLEFKSNIHLIEPLGYLEMTSLEKKCSFIVTDSGGVQKEAYFYKKPCITLRDQTEWIETVEYGWNTTVGSDIEKIISAVKNIKIPDEYPVLFGNGNSGENIMNILAEII